MTLFISIVFILSSYLSIFNVPESHGYSNQGYHLSTLSQVLTPSERFLYTFLGILPSRIYYSYKKRCYVVRGKPGYYKNDLRKKKGKRYKTVPRYQYYLNKLSPMGLIQSGLDCFSMGKTLLYGGGLNDADEEELSEISGADANADGVADANADGGADNNADGGADADADGGADADANGGANDGNNHDKEPGFFSKGINMGKGMVSPWLNVFGGSKDTNNDNNNKKTDDNEDNKEDGKAEDSIDYKEIAKDVLESDTTKNIIKAGLLFVPGGAAISTAIDAYSKYRSAEEKLDKVEDAIPILK
ncbi:hypothetical protein QTP88_007685 [Uroleucon formosanum]